MRTRCPQCHTVYDIDAQALEMAQGMARCFNCNTVFNTIENDGAASESPETTQAKKNEPENEFAELDFELELDLGKETNEQGDIDLPFEIPEDLPALKPSDAAALNVHESLHPKTNVKTPWWQKLIFAFLLITLVAQLIWFNRMEIMQHPQAEGLCQLINCSEAQQRDSNAFVVIHREIEPLKEQSGVLKLVLHFRNDAQFSQPLPDLQLSLLDSNETLLARRRITAKEYLFPNPPKNQLIGPQEVVTINLAFEDPGRRASGFKINFL